MLLGFLSYDWQNKHFKLNKNIEDPIALMHAEYIYIYTSTEKEA